MIFIFGYLLPLLIVLGCGYLAFKSNGSITHGQAGVVILCSLIPFANILFALWAFLFTIVQVLNGEYFNSRIKL